MKYQKGDRVFIKPRKMMEEEYGLKNCEQINITPVFSQEMEKQLRGRNRIITIADVCVDHYRTCRDGELGRWGTCSGWSITDDMIAGYAFDWGEEIEVSDNGKHWTKRIFQGFSPGTKLSYKSSDISFAFARPIHEPKIEIDVKVNGEAVSLSKLSEETLLRIRKESNG